MLEDVRSRGATKPTRKRVYYGEPTKKSILWRTYKKEYIMENLQKKSILWRTYKKEYIMEILQKRVYYGESAKKRVYYGEPTKKSILWRTYKKEYIMENLQKTGVKVNTFDHKAKKNIALFPEVWVAKKCLTRAAAKKNLCTQMEIQMKKENKH